MTLTVDDITNNWDGEEMIKRGANEGYKWNELHRNSLDWYTDWRNKVPEEWKKNAELEIARRDAAGIF
jgi:hypothetical protein